MNSKEVSTSYVKKRKQTTVYDFWTAPEGKRLRQAQNIADRTSFPAGCGIAKLSPTHLVAMQELCDTIVHHLPKMVPWGDGWVDKKQRGYGIVPEHSKWKNTASIVEHGIVMHDVDASTSADKKIRKAAEAKHDVTINQSFTDITLSPVQLSALHELIAHVKHILQSPHNAPHLQTYELQSIDISELVAIQPNIHNGDDYLPLHLDNPRHDGFGVVIVTLALWGSGDIVLVDDGDPECEAGTQDASTAVTHAAAVAGRSSSNAAAQMMNGASSVFEGGIVYENGKFTCTEDNTKAPQLPTPAPALALASAQPQEVEQPTQQPQPSAEAECTNQSSTSGNSCDTSTHPTEHTAQAAPLPATNDSKSWAFHLHPGELYVLSGPSRNKCAHGVVVLQPDAPDNEAQSDNNGTTTATKSGVASTVAHTTSVTADGQTTSSSTSDAEPSIVLAGNPTYSANPDGNRSESGLTDLAAAAASTVLSCLSAPSSGSVAVPAPTTTAVRARTADKASPLLVLADTAMVDHRMFSTSTESNGDGSSVMLTAVNGDACDTSDASLVGAQAASVVSDVESGVSNGVRRSVRNSARSGAQAVATAPSVVNTSNAARTNKASADRKRANTGANHKAGRVSLNFRFGLHTQEQAWNEIDRHWGK